MSVFIQVEIDRPYFLTFLKTLPSIFMKIIVDGDLGFVSKALIAKFEDLNLDLQHSCKTLTWQHVTITPIRVGNGNRQTQETCCPSIQKW